MSPGALIRATGRPRVAKGIVAVGPVAYGVLAVGFSAWGLFPVGLVAGGFWPVGLLAVGFSATGLAAAGFSAVGLLAVAFWHVVGLVAAGPSPIGLERIAVEKDMAGLMLGLAVVAAWLMDRLIRAIGSAVALPATRQKPGWRIWFVLFAFVSVACLLVTLVTLHTAGLGVSLPPRPHEMKILQQFTADVPPEKVEEYREMLVRLELLKKREGELLMQYTEGNPLVESERNKIDKLKQQQADLEREFPSLRQLIALPGGVIMLRGVIKLKTFKPPDKPISGELALTEDSAWAASCTTTQTFRLFEVPNPGVEKCTVLYRARLKTEGLVGRAYLEMWCQFPGKGESLARTGQPHFGYDGLGDLPNAVLPEGRGETGLDPAQSRGRRAGKGFHQGR